MLKDSAMISRLLIANRGEIACRIMRTAKALGIHTIAVYSVADAHAQHVQLADEAHCIGAAPAPESYLNIDAILAVARASGAQAIHPGYGFLSENADFADACAAAGIQFVGPSSHAMRAMGLKSEAKQLMRGAGVPVVPGYDGDAQSAELLQAETENIGYPVLIKAIAGGGGRGMRPVFAAGEFASALASAQREAQAAFGDARMLVEAYIPKARHVEVQILADRAGHTLALWERDCSMQRRHQKLVEEAPAPNLPDAIRARLCAAAIIAAKAVGYENAGTVEFLLNPENGQFYFMEMNTRLQVEHPVTEAITELDLVEWQLRIAAGQALPFTQADVRHDGHAIECRVNAEDPALEFLPSAGRLAVFEILNKVPSSSGLTRGSTQVDGRVKPDHDGVSIRIDSGFIAGDTVPPYYDSLLAKIIVHAPTREQAIAGVIETLAHARIAGVATNISALMGILRNPQFASGAVHTGLLPEILPEMVAHMQTIPPEIVAAGVGGLLTSFSLDARACHGVTDEGENYKKPPSPPAIAVPSPVKGEGSLAWHSPFCAQDGFQLSGVRALSYDVLCNGKPFTAQVCYENGAPQVCVNGVMAAHNVAISATHDGIFAFYDGAAYHITFKNAAQQSAALLASDGALIAPMPGRILAVHVAQGDVVEAGQALLVLEAMKMEHVLRAPHAGIVQSLTATVGQSVEMSAVLGRVN